ncbi:unnamed protein product [Lactuca saligna]|uniref:Uncharacterized protein n=1 Tax=Lactuca saligna TaxID=75948 RepID=A0AA35ZHQ0_LACSI|nr:unnamed protein product [Lactuca saligna]
MNRAILTTKNTFVDEINDILTQKFQREEKEYISFDETLDPNDQAHYEDLLHSLTPHGLPLHKLILKHSVILLGKRYLFIEYLYNHPRVKNTQCHSKEHSFQSSNVNGNSRMHFTMVVPFFAKHINNHQRNYY